MIEFHFFGMPIKTLGSLGKIRSGNRKHTYFWPKRWRVFGCLKACLQIKFIRNKSEYCHYISAPINVSPRGGAAVFPWGIRQV